MAVAAVRPARMDFIGGNGSRIGGDRASIAGALAGATDLSGGLPGLGWPVHKE